MIDPTAVAGALVRVAEESLFAWAEPVGGDAVVWPAGAWWRAAVEFAGPLAGRMDVAMPDALARQLLASFAGLSPDDAVADDALEDFLGELANMSCGTWLTSLGRSQAFAIDCPIVTSGDGQPIVTPTAVVLVSDTPVVIHASLR